MSDTYRKFEHFVQTKGLRPCGMKSLPKGEIYVAETDLEMDQKDKYPWGYYQVFFCLAGSASNGGLDGGAYMEFDALHDSDKGWTQDQRQKARIETAFYEAEQLLEKFVETGRYH